MRALVAREAATCCPIQQSGEFNRCCPHSFLFEHRNDRQLSAAGLIAIEVFHLREVAGVNDLGERANLWVVVEVARPAGGSHAQRIDGAKPRFFGAAEHAVNGDCVGEYPSISGGVGLFVGVNDDSNGICSADAGDETDRCVDVGVEVALLMGQVKAHRPIGAGAMEGKKDDAVAWGEPRKSGDDAQKCDGISGSKNCGHSESVLESAAPRR